MLYSANSFLVIASFVDKTIERLAHCHLKSRIEEEKDEMMKWFTSAPYARHRKNDQTANKTCLHGVNWGQFRLYFELLLIINFIAPQPTSSVWEQYSAVTVLPHPCIQNHSKLRSQILPHCGIKRRYLASLLTPRLCKALRAHWPSPAMILFRTSTVSTRNVFVTIYNPTRVNHTSGHIRVACPKILHHVAGV